MFISSKKTSFCIFSFNVNVYRKYLFVMGIGVFVILFSVAGINFFVDPSRIYHKTKSDGDDSPFTFVSRLVTSKYGVYFPDNKWNERDIKLALARQAESVDCAVIGSSRVMQISSLREGFPLDDMCNSIINLGVSGGTLEDYLALSYELIMNEKSPAVIIFGVDPWSLDFNRDIRWRRYEDNYNAMNRILSKEVDNANNFYYEQMTNLINPDYFLRSLGELGREKINIVESPRFDYEKGLDFPVLLPDGSLVYSKHFLEKIQFSEKEMSSKYKIKNGTQVTEYAFVVFGELIKELQKRGKRVVVMLIPYHPAVYKDELMRDAFNEVSQRLNQLAVEEGIPVRGSYNPADLVCAANEFFDDMHPKDSCLGKLYSYH